jgi:hypothetical protein
MSSALENELRTKLIVWRAAISTHDRAVVIGFCFSLFPILPLALLGLAMSAMNRALLRAGKLPSYEKPLIQKGMALGLINSFLGILIIYFAAKAVMGIDWQQAFSTAYETVKAVLDHVRSFGISPFKVSAGGTSV